MEGRGQQTEGKGSDLQGSAQGLQDRMVETAEGKAVEGRMSMDSKEIIREFNDYVDCFVECCESDKRVHELLKAVAYLIEEQEERIAIMMEGES